MQLMKILRPSFLLLACFLLGGMIFKSTAPRECATILPDDSIFVLTGDMRRIPFAMRAWREHPNTDLYIIGAGAPQAIKPAPKITIETDSKSTYQNALAIRDIARARGLGRIVLITTEDHMNRARYLVSRELPNTEIATCPVRLIGMPPAKRLERWTTEYIKYVVTLFGIKES